jgi:hypothetical protein
LQSIIRSVKPGGELVIVEDLYTGRAHGAIADKVARDWGLSRLYAASDYTEALEGFEYCTVDLSDGVERAGKIALALQSAALSLLLPLTGPRTGAVLRAFRGGLHLQRLYSENATVYAAIFCSVEQRAR